MTARGARRAMVTRSVAMSDSEPLLEVVEHNEDRISNQAIAPQTGMGRTELRFAHFLRSARIRIYCRPTTLVRVATISLADAADGPSGSRRRYSRYSARAASAS